MKFLFLIFFLCCAVVRGATLFATQINLGHTGTTPTGVTLTNGDGTITFTGAGSGTDEAFTFNLNSSNVVSISSSTGVTKFDFGSIDVEVPAEAYDSSGWNGDDTIPTKNDVRDKVEAMLGGGFGAYEDVASATTTDIGAAASYHVNITGTTTITGLGTVAAGTEKAGKFAGALTFTYNATSLILPTAANIITAAGDTFRAVSAGSGNWRVTEYLRADGTPLKLNALYGSDGTTRLNVSYTAQAAGTTINFGTTGTRALLDFTAGTPTDPTITIAAAGFYKIRAQVQVDYSGATITNQTMSLAVRRTNNTAADVSSVITITLTPSTTLSYTYGTVMIPEFEYTATAGDILSIYGTLSGATGAGNITCVAAGTAITAVRLYE